MFALCGFLIVEHGIHLFVARLGFTDKYAVGVALERALAKPDTSVLFVGTSRIKFGLDPALFDNDMRKSGFATVSYNLGVAALSFVEMEYLIDQYFAAHPCCVKYVFLEPDMVQEASLREPNSIRSISFFNLSNALRSFIYIWGERETPPPHASIWTFAKYILIPTIRHYTNAGAFQSFLNDHHDDFRAQADLNGYISQVKTGPKLSDRLDRDASLHKQYYETLDQLSKPYSPDHVSDQQVAQFMKLAAFVRSKGAEPIVLRPPQFIYAQQSASMIARIEAACSGSLIALDFGRPAANPELYDPKNRIDFDHLDGSEAERFTSMVANKFAEALESGALKAAGPSCLG